MVSEYVSYNPPTNVGMKMVRGSWFFERLAAGWRFQDVDGRPGHTEAAWRYNFTCRPRWLAPIAERIGGWILQRDIDRRIAGFARGCVDPAVLAAARKAMTDELARLTRLPTPRSLEERSDEATCLPTPPLARGAKRRSDVLPHTTARSRSEATKRGPAGQWK